MMTQKEQPGLPEKIPVHVAIIIDGDGRWALARGLPRLAGHRAGTENPSCENEMSVVQAATLSGKKIVLTGDAGRDAMGEAADYADLMGFGLPGVDRIQIPHHGSRRNVSTELLDRWLGERLAVQPEVGKEPFSAYVSSAKADPDHARNAVVRAFMHRGGRVIKTESQSIRAHGGGLSNELCNLGFHRAPNGTRSSPNITWKLCSAGFQ